MFRKIILVLSLACVFYLFFSSSNGFALACTGGKTCHGAPWGSRCVGFYGDYTCQPFGGSAQYWPCFLYDSGFGLYCITSQCYNETFCNTDGYSYCNQSGGSNIPNTQGCSTGGGSTPPGITPTAPPTSNCFCNWLCGNGSCDSGCQKEDLPRTPDDWCPEGHIYRCKPPGGCGGGPTPTPCPDIPAPEDLDVVCSSGCRSNFSWSPVTGAAYYPLRVSNESDSLAWTCPANVNDICQDDITTNYYFLDTIPGNNYRWWVHARNSCGNWSPVADGGNFTCCRNPLVESLKIAPNTNSNPTVENISVGTTAVFTGAYSDYDDPSRSGNLLMNGSFEDGLTYWRRGNVNWATWAPGEKWSVNDVLFGSRLLEVN
ncbi:MAG: hypothetical protein PHX72_02610, partial [Candidatus Shapirobacteria bacterium]|nr:hypothetical protein [Candidatus Shapirobacteria bacterium]